MQKKILKRLLVTCEYPPIIGGQATYFRNLWGGLSSENAMLVPRQCVENLGDTGMTFFPVAVPLGERWTARFLRLMLLLFALVKICIHHRPAELHFGQLVVGGFCGLLMRFFLSIPYVVHCHGADLLEFSRYFPTRMAVRLILKRARLVVANSRYTAQAIERYHTVTMHGTPVAIINPSVDLRLFTPDSMMVEKITSSLGLKGKRILLTTGRLVERKGHESVIRCLPTLKKKIDSIIYLIVGRGPYQERLEALARSCGVESSIIFCNQVTQAELAAYYHVASLFIMVPRYLKDKGDIEGFGIVYLEANAAGLAVIASKSGGILDCVKHGYNGLVVDEPDIEKEIVEAVSKVLLDRTYRAVLSKNALEQARKFSIENQRKRWIEVIEG
ncbi:MAG: glycosyltransferase family 4 protein [Chitinivibrionales bacterium]|nr:glycosyltransferase family 4 protein [Chitinivibrionales bacterium]